MASAHETQPRDQDGAQDLLGPAWQMRWRVPELTLLLSDRAVAQARLAGDRTLRLRAEAVALFASNRLGRGVSVTDRAIAGVRDAESAGQRELAAELRVELACCARSAGSHEVAMRVLDPVLEREQVDPTLRADALIEFAASLPMNGKDAERNEALNEADRLYDGATELNRDTNKLLRARVSTVRACHYRRYAEFSAAIEAAETGLALLGRLGDPEAESGALHARLVLERVLALFEVGRHDEVAGAVEPVLSQPVRAASASPSSRLRIAMATQIHLAEGEFETAVWLLNDAVAAAQRHRLDDLLAEALGMTSHVHEKCADFVEALRCLRGAYAADRRWRAAVYAARVRLLEEFPSLSHAMVPTQQTREAEQSTAEQPPSRHGRDDGDLRETAQRLMATLTGADSGLADPLYAETAATQSGVDEMTSGSVGMDFSEHSVPDPPRRSVPEPPWPDPAGQGLSWNVPDEEAEAGLGVLDDADSSWPPAHWSREPGFPPEPDETPAASHRSAEPHRPAEPQRPTEPHRPAEPQPGAASARYDTRESSTPSWGLSTWEGLFEHETTDVSDPRQQRPDATPVIPEPAEHAASRAEWPDFEQQDTPAYEATRLATDPLRSQPDPLATPNQQPRDFLATPDPRPTPEPMANPQPMTNPEPMPAGRRTRGKSLAEIRESLRVLQERGEREHPDQESSGKRHARHAESDPENQRESAADFLARYQAQPSKTRGDEDHSSHRASAQPASPGLADLLAEALLAYEDGRRGVTPDDSEPSSRHGRSNVSGIGSEQRAARGKRRSTSDNGPPRHRRPGMDAASDDQWPGTAPGY